MYYNVLYRISDCVYPTKTSSSLARETWCLHCTGCIDPGSTPAMARFEERFQTIGSQTSAN